MTPLPYIVVVVPTYHRPASLLNNTLANFLAQTYPAERRYMVILDDGQTVDAQKGKGWEVVSAPERYGSMEQKHAALFDLARARHADLAALWDDDNIYLPKYLEYHVKAILDSKLPWSTGDRFDDRDWPAKGELLERRGMTSHSVSVFRPAFVASFGGYPDPAQRDFDLEFIGWAKKASPVAHTRSLGPPQVIVRKRTSGCWRAGNFLAGHPTDGYDKMESVGITERIGQIVPAWDATTRDMMVWYKNRYCPVCATSPDPEGE